VEVYNDGRVSWKEGRELSNNSLDNRDWNNNGFFFHHVVVQFSYEGQEYLFDSDQGPVLLSSFRNHWGRLAQGSLSPEEAVGLGDNEGAWSSYFHREQIPAIKGEINRVFDEYRIYNEEKEESCMTATM